MNGRIHVAENITGLYQELVEYWLTIARQSIDNHGSFYVSLAGGSTPRQFYSLLSQSSLIDHSVWNATHVYFGDERCVPQDHVDSNFCMASEALLSQVQIPPAQIHAMYSPAHSVDENVARYIKLLDEQLPKNEIGNPVFDLVLLGMGEDGHTASLFPKTQILEEQVRPVAAQFVEKMDAWRMSLTFPVINAAEHVVLLVAGEGKAEIMSAISNAENGAMTYPVQRINPRGKLDWFLDKAAARLLEHGGKS